MSSQKSDGNLVATASGSSAAARVHTPTGGTGGGERGPMTPSFSPSTSGNMSSGTPSRPQSWAEAPTPPYYGAGGGNSSGGGSIHPNNNNNHNQNHNPPLLVTPHSASTHSIPSGVGGGGTSSGSPNSRRMWYPGHQHQHASGAGSSSGGRGGSNPSSPVMTAAMAEDAKRPSSSLDRAISPSRLASDR